MKTVGIIDYGMGNLDSVARAVEICGGEALIVSRPEDMARAGSLILPGVGSFADGMHELRARGFMEPLRRDVLERGIPLLGICLGMQLLASRGEEGGDTPGLGLIRGDVVRLKPVNGERIPHVGWNNVEFTPANPLFEGIESGKDFYFVHSYQVVCTDAADVAATTPYCGGFTSAVRRDCVFGTQFHPEKSQKPGLRVLENYLGL